VPAPPRFRFAATVDAPPGRLAALLLDVAPGRLGPAAAPVVVADQGAVTVSGRPPRFEVTLGEGPGAHTVFLDVDPRAREVALQGHWWYRGVYRVQPAGGASRLVHEVRNVAPAISRWMVLLVDRGGPAAHRPGFEALLARIRQRLGCATGPVEEG
jgi:hypothetical protein